MSSIKRSDELALLPAGTLIRDAEGCFRVAYTRGEPKHLAGTYWRFPHSETVGHSSFAPCLLPAEVLWSPCG